MLGKKGVESSTVKPSKEAAYPYIMESFLRSRTESGHPSNIDYYEEDVNVYIVNLLCLLLDPVYHLRIRDYVAGYDSDVFDKVRGTKDNRLRYRVYKANADHLLISLGLFGRGDEGMRALSRAEDPERAAGRGKIYYSFARSYCEVLERRSRGVADVLGKLSHGFDKYVEILEYMRGEYLDLIDRLSEGEMFHLLRDIDRVEDEERARAKYDELLDLYLEWKRTGDDGLLRKLKDVASEIEALDPSFRFELPGWARNN